MSKNIESTTVAQQPGLVVGIIVGTEHVKCYEAQGVSAENIEAVTLHHFNSEKEASAFVQGFEEATGWTEYDMADDDQLRARGYDPELTVLVAFGESACVPDLDEQVDVENDRTLDLYKFETPEERKAFELGLGAGEGGLSSCQLSDESVAAYQLASAKHAGQKPTVQGFKLVLKNGKELVISTYLDDQEVRNTLVGLLDDVVAIEAFCIDADERVDHRACDDNGLLQAVREEL